jgi:hypothetical protein
MLVSLAGGGGCLGGLTGTDPEVATLFLLFPGADTVMVDISSGQVSSGPITMFSTIDFTAEFFADDGTPDTRVTETAFVLNVVPLNTGVVTFTRGSSFSGTLNKVAGGTTEITFALVKRSNNANLFSWNVPVEVN